MLFCKVQNTLGKQKRFFTTWKTKFSEFFFGGGDKKYQIFLPACTLINKTGFLMELKVPEFFLPVENRHSKTAANP